MAKFIRIPVSSIHVGERQRPIDADHAIAIAASMEERGLINPVTVRSTPNQGGGKTPFTLVAGGHRLFAAKSLAWDEIDAIMVAADANEAILIEIAENLFRNELTALNRALFVAKYRETWEEAHGDIKRGGNTFVSNSKGSKGHNGPLMMNGKHRHDGGVFFAPGRELSERVQERLGISGRTYKRISQIAMNLHPDLRQALRGTDIEDDQSKLLKLAKLDPEKQASVAAALSEGADFAKVMSWLKPHTEGQEASKSEDATFKRLVALWDSADEDTRRRFLQHVGNKEDFSFLEVAE